MGTLTQSPASKDADHSNSHFSSGSLPSLPSSDKGADVTAESVTLLDVKVMELMGDHHTV